MIIDGTILRNTRKSPPSPPPVNAKPTHTVILIKRGDKIISRKQIPIEEAAKIGTC